jgi:hypothetical protein
MIGASLWIWRAGGVAGTLVIAVWAAYTVSHVLQPPRHRTHQQ